MLCFASRFGVDLQISDKVFVMDAGASNSKDMKLLRSHLHDLRINIISVSRAKHTATHTQTQTQTDKMYSDPELPENSKPVSLPPRPLQRCSPMTLLSERLLTTLPAWRKLSGPNQLTSWQQFVSDVQEHINPLVSQNHLRTLALQLHSMGEVHVGTV